MSSVSCIHSIKMWIIVFHKKTVSALNIFHPSCTNLLIKEILNVTVQLGVTYYFSLMKPGTVKTIWLVQFFSSGDSIEVKTGLVQLLINILQETHFFFHLFCFFLFSPCFRICFMIHS